MKKNHWMNLALLAPGTLIYVLFMLLPILLCFYYAFTNWNGLSATYEYVGFDNFIRTFSDQRFHHAIWITFLITVTATLGVNLCGVMFSVLLNHKGRLTPYYRAVFFFPQLLSPVVVGFLWKAILSYNGLFNRLMDFFHLPRIEFFGVPDHALMTLIALVIWQSTGFVIVLYLAGLQTISRELYEAAHIDGANAWQQFKRITFPLLAPAVTMSVIFMFTALMREYDRVAVLTYGGPGTSTETLAYYITQIGFTSNRLSYASSLAVMMFLIVSVLSVTLTIYLRKREDQVL